MSRRLLSNLVLCIVAGTGLLWAQSVELNGNITDPQGRLVPGASIRLEKDSSEWRGRCRTTPAHSL